MDAKLLFVGASYMGIHPRKCKMSTANLFSSWCVRFGCINEPFSPLFRVSLFFKPEKVFPSQLPTLQGITHRVLEIQTHQLPPEPKILRSSWFLNFPSNLSVSYESKLMYHCLFNCLRSCHGLSLMPTRLFHWQLPCTPQASAQCSPSAQEAAEEETQRPVPCARAERPTPSALLDLERSGERGCVLHLNIGDEETFLHPHLWSYIN